MLKKFIDRIVEAIVAAIKILLNQHCGDLKTEMADNVSTIMKEMKSLEMMVQEQKTIINQQQKEIQQLGEAQKEFRTLQVDTVSIQERLVDQYERLNAKVEENVAQEKEYDGKYMQVFSEVKDEINMLRNSVPQEVVEQRQEEVSKMVEVKLNVPEENDKEDDSGFYDTIKMTVENDGIAVLNGNVTSEKLMSLFSMNYDICFEDGNVKVCTKQSLPAQEFSIEDVKAKYELEQKVKSNIERMQLVEREMQFFESKLEAQIAKIEQNPKWTEWLPLDISEDFVKEFSGYGKCLLLPKEIIVWLFNRGFVLCQLSSSIGNYNVKVETTGQRYLVLGTEEIYHLQGGGASHLYGDTGMVSFISFENDKEFYLKPMTQTEKAMVRKQLEV